MAIEVEMMVYKLVNVSNNKKLSSKRVSCLINVSLNIKETDVLRETIAEADRR